MTTDLDWIELVLGFGCNCRCQVCPSWQLDADSALSSREIATHLKAGRERGARHVWFGGGEPTLHPDLIAAVGRASRLGYERIRVQSNGMRFSYPAYAEAFVAAGGTEAAVTILGADAERQDRVTQTADSFEIMSRGVDTLVGLGITVEADLLITTGSMPGLAETVERFARRGIRTFRLWLASLHGAPSSTGGLTSQVPSFAELGPHLRAAFAAAALAGVAIETLHTPPCVLDPGDQDHYRHAGHWRLLVVTPGNEPFLAEASPIEGGRFLDTCEGCSRRGDCLGFRDDYLNLHGNPGVEPIS